MSEAAYNATELMIINAARLLQDGDQVFVGVGIPNLACNLARRTHAPHLQMIYEAGVIGAQPERLPLSIGDPTLVSGALAVCSMFDIFSFYLQRGNIDVGFLGGAQIDQFGNINATVIGDYFHPRFACQAPVGQWRSQPGQTAVTSSPRTKSGASQLGLTFILRLIFEGGDARAKTGVRGAGPQAVVTNLCILKPNEQGELILAALHPGCTFEEVQANTGWQLKQAPQVEVTPAPTPEELRILREELDPQRIYI